MHEKRRDARHWRLFHGLLLIGMSLFAEGCGAFGSYVYEQLANTHQEGTLLVGEVIFDLNRRTVLARFSPDDLARAGWTVADVVNGTGLVIQNFGQKYSGERRVHALYALIPRSMFDSVIAHRHPEMRPYKQGSAGGGDAVTVRVVRVGSEGDEPTGLNLVEAVIEPADRQGDCLYQDRGEDRPAAYRYGLYCKSLLSQGWEWDGAEFVKRP